MLQFFLSLCCSKAASRGTDVALELVLLVYEHQFHLQLQIMIQEALQLEHSSLSYLKLIQSLPSISDCYPIPTVWRAFHPDDLQHFPWV